MGNTASRFRKRVADTVPVQRISTQARAAVRRPLMPGVPKGLEDLPGLNKLYIRKRLEPIEIAVGVETANTYDIFSGTNKHLYTAYEDEQRHVFSRVFFGSRRPFEMTIIDARTQDEILSISRPYRMWTQELEVYSPSDGNTLGYVVKRVTVLKAYLEISNRSNVPILKIRGPAFSGFRGIGRQINFEILTMNDEHVGSIVKTWTGLLREYYSDSTNYEITFSPQLSATSKALIISATVLMDFTLYERSGRGHGRRGYGGFGH